MPIATINPATGETIQHFPPLTDAELESKLALADQTFQHYRRTTLSERATWLRNAAQQWEDNRQDYGALMTLEMGKPIIAAIAEVEKSAWVCRFYADRAAEFLADVPIPTNASNSFVCYQPMGIILAVMPWNFPFWQVFRFAAPALMAGNVGILKHASNVPQSALAIESIFQQAGLPTGAFQTLLVGADRVAAIVNDPRVRAATLTGSESAGASLGAAAGKALKKIVLELGGSDPFIVMDSSNIEDAANTAVTARLINNGQSCIAAKRFILHEAIADEFAQRMLTKFQALTIGDPSLPETDIGPLATPGILKELDDQVQRCLGSGAIAVTGGYPLTDKHLPPTLQPGNFYAPTILTNFPPNSPAHHEEFFGPVALLFRVPDLDSAIQLANSTDFGLGASAWTTVDAEIQRFSTELEAGCVFINSMVKSDPRLPFGGIKRSGYGRELGSQGIHEFVNIKTVWIR